MHERVMRAFKKVAPDVDACTLRLVDERSEEVRVRRGVLEPVFEVHDTGAMITVHDSGGVGYAATADLSESGLADAVSRARAWAEMSREAGLFEPAHLTREGVNARHQSPAEAVWHEEALSSRIDATMQAAAALHVGDSIVDWRAALHTVTAETLLLDADGNAAHQEVHLVIPDLGATAYKNGETQVRSFGGRGRARQGGLEALGETGFHDVGERLGEEAIALCDAPDCPTGKMDILLAPDQMMLQIHESIGHPLELDRILGDERNYAGRSFVSLDMFGDYRYGSDLLNVTFDPGVAGQLASYAFDDEGTAADRVFVIEKGILKRPLGGALSQARAGMEGTANARATSWNRPPIDRMANLNVEPGETDFKGLVSSIEDGVYMETNCSWSIDDSRNKFQFGCELGRVIKNGELQGLVKKPNYRGVSATFWRALRGVGDASTWEILGTPYCGKGEPNQVIRVGHASPACWFEGIDVFGGDS